MKVRLTNRILPCFLAALLLPAQGIAQSPEDRAEPSWVIGAIRPETRVDVIPAIRTARAHAFDDKHRKMKPLDQLESLPYERGATIIIADRAHSEPLPVENSDAIVVATVTGYESFLSLDRSSIFTELYLTCERVLKDTTDRIEGNHEITILKRGGTVFAGERKLTSPRVLDGSEPLDVGYRYVLFLKYNKALDSYTDVDGWRLTTTGPVPLMYVQRVAAGSDNDLLAYSRDTENQFVQAIQEKLDSLAAVK
jgi:hypothetical protein